MAGGAKQKGQGTQWIQEVSHGLTGRAEEIGCG